MRWIVPSRLPDRTLSADRRHTLPGMKIEFNPLKLDVTAFAREQGVLSGEWPLLDLHRLQLSLAPDVQANAAPPVRWQVRGDIRPVLGGAHQTWLHLEASAVLPMQCQRCLQAVDHPLHVQCSVRFVADEELAARLDAECEDDVLVISHNFDLREWVEDELILELPLIPRHAVCPQPLPVASELLAADAPVERVQPFAVLAALKNKKS